MGRFQVLLLVTFLCALQYGESQTKVCNTKNTIIQIRIPSSVAASFPTQIGSFGPIIPYPYTQQKAQGSNCNTKTCKNGRRNNGAGRSPNPPNTITLSLPAPPNGRRTNIILDARSNDKKDNDTDEDYSPNDEKKTAIDVVVYVEDVNNKTSTGNDGKTNTAAVTGTSSKTDEKGQHVAADAATKTSSPDSASEVIVQVKVDEDNDEGGDGDSEVSATSIAKTNADDGKSESEALSATKASKDGKTGKTDASSTSKAASAADTSGGKGSDKPEEPSKDEGKDKPKEGETPKDEGKDKPKDAEADKGKETPKDKDSSPGAAVSSTGTAAAATEGEGSSAAAAGSAAGAATGDSTDTTAASGAASKTGGTGDDKSKD